MLAFASSSASYHLPDSPELDLITFSVPADIGCRADDDWRLSSNVFFSPAYPVKLPIWRNACVCSTGQNGDMVWALRNASTSLARRSHQPSGHGNHPILVETQPPTLGHCNTAHARAVSGVSVVGQAWPSMHAGHQQECAFPMLQLLGKHFADRMMHLVANKHRPGRRSQRRSDFLMTPFVTGLTRALGLELPIVDVSNSTYCFDEVAICTGPFAKQPQGSGWHSMRHSRLVPQASGQLVVPTRDQANAYTRAARRYCNLSSAEDDAKERKSSPMILTGRVLLRSGTARSVLNLDGVLHVLRRHLRNVTVLYIDDLCFCTQVQWLDAGVVLSVHGSHLVNQAFMRAGTHLIEILPWLYEQDYNTAGCAARQRHVLVGEPMRKGNLSARLESSTAWSRQLARTDRVKVPLVELDKLVSRIITHQTARGRYVCSLSRCAYV